MNYKETGFRVLYKHFAAFMLTDRLREIIEGFPNAEKANCILTYGYIDHTAGFTLEILATGKRNKNDFRFYDGSDEFRSIIRVDVVENDEFFQFENSEGKFRERYAKKVEISDSYKESDAIESTRSMQYLDSFRHPHYVDDVLVYLLKDGCKPEGCWVRLEDVKGRLFIGELLNEPDQDLGCHIGERIGFFFYRQDNSEPVCICNLNPQ